MRAPRRVLLAGAALLGVALVATGLLKQGRITTDDLQRLGAIVLILTGLLAAAHRRQFWEAAVERARVTGYDDGFSAGVAAESRSHRAAGTLTLLRPAQEFPEQQDVGRVADRVN